MLSKQILLVETASEEASHLQKQLAGAGYSVVRTSSRPEGLRLAAQLQPLAVIVGVAQAEEYAEALAFCRTLKKPVEDATVPLWPPSPPIVIYSQERRVAKLLKAYQAGADYYLVREADDPIQADQALLVVLATIYSSPAQVSKPLSG